MKKVDLINILVEEYGYEKEDIKLFTNGKLINLIKQEKEDLENLEVEMTYSSPLDKIEDDSLITIMSGCECQLFYTSRQTGREWIFEGFGQIERMPFRELVTIKNSNNALFKDGYIIILDKVIQKEFGLSEMYKNILTPENLEETFKKDVEELDSLIDKLPEAMKITFFKKARQMYENKQLDSATKIEFIQKKFDVSFDDNAPLGDIV